MKNYTITVNGTAYNVSVDHEPQIALDERLLGALASRSKLPQQRLLLLPHRLLPLIPQSPAL